MQRARQGGLNGISRIRMLSVGAGATVLLLMLGWALPPLQAIGAGPSPSAGFDPALMNASPAPANGTAAALFNLSTRARVREGAAILIGGFVIRGDGPKRVLIRARGPSLAAAGVPGAMPDPQLRLLSGATELGANDDWKNGGQQAEIAATGRAPQYDAEAALLATLAPGAYTVQIQAARGASGVAIFEVIGLDEEPDSRLFNISTRASVETGTDVTIGGFVIRGTSPKQVLIRARGPSMAGVPAEDVLSDPTLELFAGATRLAENDNWGTGPDAAAITATGRAPAQAAESAILATLEPGAYTAVVRGAGATTGVGIVEVIAIDELAPSAELNQAVLGPLSGAEIRAYRLTARDSPIEGPITAGTSLTDLAAAGTFSLNLNAIPDNEWVLVTASGGQDIDADDDGVLDPEPTANLGTLHALARTAEWRSGGRYVNILTELAWQSLSDELASGEIDDLEGRLTWIANQLFRDDITGDGNLDGADLTAFDPRRLQFREALRVPFEAFQAEDANGSSLFDKIHQGQVDAVRDWITSVFGDRLQPPRVPELVDTAIEVLLPPNRAGLLPQDLVISSSVSSGAQVLDEGATLMIAKDAEGRTVLLAFALPGKVTEFSARSTALALVMLSLGGGRDTDTFTQLADLIESLVNFDVLVLDIENLLAADPFFLERLDSYVSLVEQIQAVVAKVRASITMPSAAESALAEQRLAAAADPGFPISKDGFYRIPLLTKSPWYDSQPWHWYGDAKGAEVFWPENRAEWIKTIILGGFAPVYTYITELLPDFVDAPFLAVAKNDRTEIALANPGAALYQFQILDGAGLVSNWFISPRNSTVIDKLLNSGATRRSLFSVENKGNPPALSNRVLEVRFSKKEWWIVGLNAFHASVAVVNLFTDVSEVNNGIELLVSNEKALFAFQKCAVGFLDDLPNELYWDAARPDDWAAQLKGFVEFDVLDVLSVFTSPEGLQCMDASLRLVGYKAWGKLLSKLLARAGLETVLSSTPAGWVKASLDGLNETVPVVASVLWVGSYQQYYYLTWGTDAENNPILVDVSTTPPPPASPQPPQPRFINVQMPREGLRVHFDAAQSQLDPRAVPTYSWNFGDGATGSGEQTSHLFAAAGTKTVRVKVDDGLGQVEEWEETVNVTDGRSPTIDSMTCRLDPNNSRRVLISATVSDADSDLTSLNWWRAPLVFEVTPDLTTGPEVTEVALDYPDDDVSSYAPTLRARDAAGNETAENCVVYAGRSGTFPLNDTGITWCASGSANNLPCPVSGYPDQDAQYGRDATHNDDSDGHAGFSFTKLDAGGNALPSGASQWACVRDNVTGLVWEVKTTSGLRSLGNKYTWYNPDSGTNGGLAGTRNGGSCIGSACDTHAFVQAVNTLGLCGKSDWRLPSKLELMSIVSNDRVPAIDTTYFANTLAPPVGSAVWTSSPYAGDPKRAWVVGFSNGDVGDNYKRYKHYVRLVRGGQ